MVKALIDGRKGLSTKGSGSMAKCTGAGYLSLATAEVTRANTRITTSMAGVSSNGLLRNGTRATGTWADNTGKGLCAIRRESAVRGFGSMEN
jgi:hypothetical protein